MEKDRVRVKVSHVSKSEVDRYLNLIITPYAVAIKPPKKKGKFYTAYAVLKNISKKDLQ
jgi:hypothetical protein